MTKLFFSYLLLDEAGFVSYLLLRKFEKSHRGGPLHFKLVISSGVPVECFRSAGGVLPECRWSGFRGTGLTSAELGTLGR